MSNSCILAIIVTSNIHVLISINLIFSYVNQTVKYMYKWTLVIYHVRKNLSAMPTGVTGHTEY